MLDSYTSNMYLSSWGRSTYARALIEVLANNEIMESLTIAIPVGKDKGHTLATIDIKYEWKPPRCSTCMIFDHFTDKCPKLPKENIQTNTDDEGFVEVKKKKNMNKSRPQRQVDGIRLSKPPPKLFYRRVETGDSSKAAKTQTNPTKVQPIVSKPAITVKNAFDVLDREGKEDELLHDQENKRDDVLNVRWMRKFWLMRSHVADPNLARICSLVFKHWDWTSNGARCDKGTRIIVDRPWCLLGDFNATLFLEDSTASGANIDISMREFRDCVEEIEVMAVHRTGLQFTWNQKP
ncbi:zinc knuckle CX2CX4HX4C containing protein, partial [Tanacetum coccineum]